MKMEDVGRFVTMARNLVTELYHLPVPTIAAIDGVALGGGLEFALACDLRIAGRSSKLGLVETRLAIIPGAGKSSSMLTICYPLNSLVIQYIPGGTQHLPRLVGMSKAKELIFTAKILNGEESEKIGLVNYVVEDNKVYDKAVEIASTILPQGPIALTMAKNAMNRGTEVKAWFHRFNDSFKFKYKQYFTI